MASHSGAYAPGQRTYSYHAPGSSVVYHQVQTVTSYASTSQTRQQPSPYTPRPALPTVCGVPFSFGIQPSLHCDEERIDGRRSPDLWPEPVPGALDIGRQNTVRYLLIRFTTAQVLVPTQKASQRFNTQLDPDDVRLVNGKPYPYVQSSVDLGRLSANQLFEYVSTLQNNALLLGVDESKSTLVLKICRQSASSSVAAYYRYFRSRQTESSSSVPAIS